MNQSQRYGEECIFEQAPSLETEEEMQVDDPSPDEQHFLDKFKFVQIVPYIYVND